MGVVLGSGESAGKHRPGLDSFSTRNHIIVTVTSRERHRHGVDPTVVSAVSSPVPDTHM